MLALFPDQSILCYWGKDLLLRDARPPFTHERLHYVDSVEFQSRTAGIVWDSPGVSKFGDCLYLWHPNGEQEFLRTFLRMAKDSPNKRLVIRSGGLFGIGGKGESEKSRRTIYQEFVWMPEVSEGLKALNLDKPYVGLHIRGTDLLHLAPSETRLENSIVNLTRSLNVRHVYVSADNQSSQEHWQRRLEKLDLRVSFQPNVLFSQDATGLITSAIDFLTLSGSEAMVYSHTSSFGQESAIQTTYPKLCKGLYPEKRSFRYAVNQFLGHSAIMSRTRALLN